MYYSHRQAGSDLVLQLENKLLLDEKMEQIEVEYSNGLISTIQYKMQKQEHSQGIMEYLRVSAEYIKLDYGIQLLQKGILPTSSY